MLAYCGFTEVIPALFYFVPLTLFNVCECTDRSILKSQGRTIARYVFVGILRAYALPTKRIYYFIFV